MEKVLGQHTRHCFLDAVGSVRDPLRLHPLVLLALLSQSRRLIKTKGIKCNLSRQENKKIFNPRRTSLQYIYISHTYNCLITKTHPKNASPRPNPHSLLCFVRRYARQAPSIQPDQIANQHHEALRCTFAMRWFMKAKNDTGEAEMPMV